MLRKKRPTIPVSDEVATKTTYKSNTRQVKGEANGRACVAMVSCDVELYEIKAKCPTDERIDMSSRRPFWSSKTIQQQFY